MLKAFDPRVKKEFYYQNGEWFVDDMVADLKIDQKAVRTQPRHSVLAPL